ncbi:MAG TPA: hypothetical protein VLB80_03550 [Candidatus Babeliales bacterium]|nr:hypothetical protein [Candidatus Babeliales bacterium]
MKRCFSRYRLALFALFLVSFGMKAEQIWKGTSGGNVIDEDLVIKGDVLLQLGGTKIEAVHKNITITLEDNATIQGHWAGESQLYLVAAAGKTIRFKINHNLSLIGSSQITGDDLLIVQSGPGTVEVAIAEGKTFSLTSQNCSGGALYYVLMYGGENAPKDEYCCDEYTTRICGDEYATCHLACDEYCGDEYSCSGSGRNETSKSRPTLSFVNLETSHSSGQNRKILIGSKSRMSFLSSRKINVAQDSGYITFDPVMNKLGRMILEIEDGGAFVAAGHYTCQRNGCYITLSAINLAIAAGYQAIWQTSNSVGADASAGLLVLDRNEKLSELLFDPFLNLGARDDTTDYRGAFSGKRYGVILGANGILNIGSESYVDFVGLALNQLPTNAVVRCEKSNLTKLIKMRNPSAFIIDGNNNPSATDAQITFGAHAALFLRSGIASDGEIRDENDVDPFTIDPANKTNGIGNIVFDLEGELDVRGTRVDDTITSKIELLSLEVIPTGGSLFVGSGETNFPLRTFNTEDDQLLMYNCGAFLINNTMNLYDTALSHTDECHTVCSNNDLRSEPAYIGGETFKLLESDIRPNIRFLNSQLDVNSDIALTGFDLVVPNFVDEFGVLHANLSEFIFYSNGAAVDNGTGRQMILGTRIGSTAADGCSRIDGETYLDIMQQDDAISSDLDPLDPNGNQTLSLTTAFNDATVNNLIVNTANDSIHTIFLGGNSNISIGVNADTTGFNIDTNPWLRIAGNVFSFEARGGAATVTRSNITGRNAIFVDLNGKISIDPGFIANMGVMVIKSHNGIVDLPADQVFFSNGAGIATWDVNLRNASSQIIVGSDQSLSTYIFNWMLAQKDFPNYTPFNCCVDSCSCPAVTEANVTSLPTIQGNVDNFTIQGTRIGDPIQFLIDGGSVGQLTFLNNNCSAEAPVATIVLRNNGTVGLDSTTTLGANGVTIIADGSGRILVNNDLIINNVCAFVKGPNFPSCGVLELYSPVPREIRLKSTGTLNLTSFNDVSQIIAFLGELSLVIEPGATIVTGAGTLRFAENSQLLFEAATDALAFFSAIPFGMQDSALPIITVNAALPHNPLSSLISFGAGLNNTDQFRVKIIGSGTIEIVDNAQGLIPFNAFVGIETINTAECSIPTTDITLSIADNGTFAIGHLNVNEGGVLQIGNVNNLVGHIVNFTLTLDGDDANFTIGSRGFLGLGAGIERFDGFIPLVTRARTCPSNFTPNENIVNTLSNVGMVTFKLLNGRFEHDRIFSGNEVNASLLAIGDVPGSSYFLTFELPDENIDPTLERSSNFNIAGGGNIVLIEPGVGGVQPIVLDQDGMISSRLSAGVMASTLLESANETIAGLSGAELFDYFKTHDAVLEADRDNAVGRANAASQGDSFRPEFENIRIDTVANGMIIRGPAFDIIGAGQQDSKRRAAMDTAAVFVNIDPELNEILTVTNIEV